MPTYLYECPIHGEFESEHSIMEKLEHCPKCETEHLLPQKVKRLIAGGGSFILMGNGWAKDSYS